MLDFIMSSAPILVSCGRPSGHSVGESAGIANKKNHGDTQKLPFFERLLQKHG